MAASIVRLYSTCGFAWRGVPLKHAYLRAFTEKANSLVHRHFLFFHPKYR